MGKVYEKGLGTMADQTDISQNSQKLFNYLLCLAGNPPNMQKRVFQHKNINLTQISATIDLSVNSIKKYWWELERNNKIFYGNDNIEPEETKKLRRELIEEWQEKTKKEITEMTDKEEFEIWKKLWVIRKKRPCEYYEVNAGHQKRNIPKETLKMINEELHFSEQDIKLYQYLLTYREIGIEKMYQSFDFSMQDLRTFLGKKKEQKNHISIYKSLLLLKSYELIDFEERFELNQKNKRIRHFILTNVNFYITSKYKDCEEDEKSYINQSIQDEIAERIKSMLNNDIME